jgi:hypothetical protein
MQGIFDIYIVAGGNSLRGFDFGKLKGKEIIAVNESLHFVPFAQTLVALDKDFYYRDCVMSDMPKHDIWLKDYKGKMYNDRNVAGTIQIPYHPANNSGYMAVKLAIEMKPDRIFLLGYDMHRIKYVHFYDNIPIEYSDIWSSTKMWIEDLEHDCEIINACLDSKIETFPKISLENLPI